jgi:hypothetical protein
MKYESLTPALVFGTKLLFFQREIENGIMDFFSPSKCKILEKFTKIQEIGEKKKMKKKKKRVMKHIRY